MNEIVWYVVVGVIGAGSRLLVQWFRDGEIKQTPLKIAALLGLGAVGGWVSLQLLSLFEIQNYITAWALGFVFPDVAENIAARFSELK